MACNDGPRIVLGIGILAGVVHAGVFPLYQPEQVALATDVYYHAVNQFLRGAEVYGRAPPTHPGFTYNYPPVFLLVFLPHALTGSPLGAYLFQTSINLAAAGFLAIVLTRFIAARRDLDSVDRLFIGVFTLVSVPMVSNLVMGQINVVLALAIGLGVTWIETDRPRSAGTAFGAAAAVKLFPTLFGAWLLRRRAWTAIAAATATGLSAIMFGLLVFGWETTHAFLIHLLEGELPVGSFSGGPDPTAPYVTIRRQLAYLLPGLSSTQLFVIGALILAPIVGGLNWYHDTIQKRMIGFLGTVLATLILFPFEPFYLVIATFPLVATLYLLDPSPERSIVVFGSVLLVVPLTTDSLTPILQSTTVPATIGDPLQAVMLTIFEFALLPMIGVWLIIAGGLSLQARATS